MKVAIDFSKGDIVFILKESNIENLTTKLEQMYEQHKNGKDIIILTTPYKRFKEKLFLKVMNIITANKFSKNYDLLFLISRRVLNAYTDISSKIMPFSIAVELTGYDTNSILFDTKHKERLSKEEYTFYLMMISDIVPKFAFRISLTCFFISTLGAIYAIFVYLSGKVIVEGWTSIFILTSVGFYGVFIILSVITRYFKIFGKEIENTLFIE